MRNPLLPDAGDDGPLRLDLVRPQHAEPAIDQVLCDLGEPHDRVQRVWEVVTQLYRSLGAPEWRAAGRACFAKVVDCQANGSESSAALADGAKQRLRAISIRAVLLQAEFSENALDATQAQSKHVVDETKLAGVPQRVREQARRRARLKGVDGFLLTLDSPTYDAVISHADDRDLRHELYQANTTRASDRGPCAGRFDNGPLIDEILAVRHERATLLGFRSSADALSQTHLVGPADDAERFFLELNARVRPRALAELEEVWTFAKSRDGIKGFRPWDLPYYSEKLTELRLGASQEELRAYFPTAQVLQGMFALAERLYGIRVAPAYEVDGWHPDVTVYRLYEASGALLSTLYLDLYCRDDKRSGAWVSEALDRRPGRRAVRSSAAFLSCNLAPPLPGEAALLSQDELRTLGRQWGRVLYFVQARSDVPDVSRGFEPAEDGAELSARFMLNQCYEKSTLTGMARHAQTGEPLPAPLLEHMLARRATGSSLATLRDIELALFDLRLHRDYVPAERSSRLRSQVLDAFAQARREVNLLPPPPWDRSANSLLELFGDGAVGGYYGRKWAELRSTDLCASFDRAGLPSVGGGFRELLLRQSAAAGA